MEWKIIECKDFYGVYGYGIMVGGKALKWKDVDVREKDVIDFISAHPEFSAVFKDRKEIQEFTDKCGTYYTDFSVKEMDKINFTVELMKWVFSPERMKQKGEDEKKRREEGKINPPYAYHGYTINDKRTSQTYLWEDPLGGRSGIPISRPEKTDRVITSEEFAGSSPSVCPEGGTLTPAQDVPPEPLQNIEGKSFYRVVKKQVTQTHYLVCADSEEEAREAVKKGEGKELATEIIEEGLPEDWEVFEEE